MSPSAYIDAHASDLVALLQRLVRLPTVNPPGDHYDAITRLLADELNAAGLKTKRFTIPPRLLKQHLPPAQHGFPRYNVLGKLAARGAKKTLHFNAHYDVVPVSGDWRHGSPFSGAVERGWIYGRGTADMKGSHASLLLALRALKATGVVPKTHIEVSFTADEETDSELGAGWLVKHAPIRPDYAIVMEGGEGNGICCGHNGVVWLNVTVHGRAAHGSRPEHGINALEKMSALVGALDAYKRLLAKRTFTAPDGTVKTPTINLGGIFAPGEGGKINTVPALASFSIDRRVLPVETVAAAEKELRAFLQQAAKAIPQCRITVEKVSDNHPCFTPPEGPFFAAMADCVTRVRRVKSVFRTSYGFNDMHFFSHHLKIPTLGHGPGGDHCHAVDERASVRELVASAKIYAELMTTFAG
ncbi:MAG: acetylornithine deacetylase [Rariglobus sp.]|jgi:succinyl-diaminopimelate desuccinylase|nr:acetylornithine deacetylase [Rariglobus sp.]